MGRVTRFNNMANLSRINYIKLFLSATHNINAASVSTTTMTANTSILGENKMLPIKSKMMEKLYGLKASNHVYKLLQELDPEFNEEIQRIAYDHYWKLPGLSIRDKSLVTVVSLIASCKEEQTKIHINGFLNLGGTKEDILNVLIYLIEIIGLDSIKKSFEALCEVLKERNEKNEVIQEINILFTKKIKNIDIEKLNAILSKRDRYIINIASCVAIGEQGKIRNSIKDFLTGSECSKDDLKNILIHQIVYCGFPAVMNGFTALKNVLDDNRIMENNNKLKAKL